MFLDWKAVTNNSINKSKDSNKHINHSLINYYTETPHRISSGLVHIEEIRKKKKIPVESKRKFYIRTAILK